MSIRKWSIEKLIFVAGLPVLLCACRKDNLQFTSEVPNGYRTDVFVDYYEPLNSTTVSVGFRMVDFAAYDYQEKYFVIAPDGFIKFNGNELTVPSGSQFYLNQFDGKTACVIEFTDYDGTIFTNVLIPPDTAYFVNLPDTIASFEDFQLEISPALADSNEKNYVSIDSYGVGDNVDWLYYGTDSLPQLSYYPNLAHNQNHMLFLTRSKYLLNPNLPLGGGSITYNYIVGKSFYTP